MYEAEKEEYEDDTQESEEDEERLRGLIVVSWWMSELLRSREASELTNLREKDGEYVEGRATLSERKIKSWRSRYGLMF